MANGKYVSNSECGQRMGTMGKDVGMIKRALVGDDMRGGLVKDMATVKGQLTEMANDKAEAREEKKRSRAEGHGWKIAAFSFLTGLVCVVVGVVLGVILKGG